MIELVVACVAFVGSHVVLSSTSLRAVLVSALGKNGFLVVFSLVAFGTIAWMSHAYAAAPMIEVWPSTTFFRHLAGSVMVAAAILVVGGMTAKSPTSFGGETSAGFSSKAPLPGFLAVTRHPMLWGFGLWAIVHVLANGDAASVLFFGSLGLLAFGGTVLIDRKRAANLGQVWVDFAARTSNPPFAAVVRGRARLSLSAVGVWRLVLGVGLYLLLLFAHEPVIGIWPLWVGTG